jgi:cation transporter-like permease
MGKSSARLNTLGKIALIGPLLAILAAAAWYAASAWTSVNGPPMPATGYIAMALGVVFSLLVGCGLMALLFYSSRHGYDEPFRPDDDRD